jgi:ADP-sugar diphosphatase
VLDRLDIAGITERLSRLKTQEKKLIPRILDYEKLWLAGIRDAKTLVAWSLYEALKRARHPDLAETNTW